MGSIKRMRTVWVCLLLFGVFSGDLAQRRVPPLEEMVRRLDSLSQNRNDLLKISDVTFANLDPLGTIINDFGSRLYEDDLQYLVPRIAYEAKSNCQMDLMIKLYGDDGFSVTKDFSVTFNAGSKRYTDDIEPICNGLDAGDYTYELWNRNTKIYSGRVNVKSGSPKVTDCSLFKVKDVKFYNLIDGKRTSQFGEKLFAADVRYLAAAIFYTDLVDKAALMKAIYYVRLYTPDGCLVKCFGDTAVGYTYYASPTNNDLHSEYFLVNGIGRDTENRDPGTYRYEVWMDNCKIVDTNVTLY